MKQKLLSQRELRAVCRDPPEAPPTWN